MPLLSANFLSRVVFMSLHLIVLASAHFRGSKEKQEGLNPTELLTLIQPRVLECEEAERAHINAGLCVCKHGDWSCI